MHYNDLQPKEWLYFLLGDIYHHHHIWKLLNLQGGTDFGVEPWMYAPYFTSVSQIFIGATPVFSLWCLLEAVL